MAVFGRGRRRRRRRRRRCRRRRCRPFFVCYLASVLLPIF